MWDVYSSTSLKPGTREQRGSGARRKVTFSTKVPGYRAAFLRVDQNKQELFVEIGKSLQLLELPDEKQLYTTILEDCASSPPDQDVSTLAPCNQMEFDSRIVLHVAAATSCGHRKVIVRTTDSDVVVLPVSAFVALEHQIEELWVAFGIQRRFRYIPIHVIVEELGTSKAAALPTFHALTGCNTTSALFGKGKKSTWIHWQSFPDLTVALQALAHSNPCLHPLKTHTPVLKKFVTRLNGVSDDEITTGDAVRPHLFLQRGNDFLQMPPGSDTLHQHLLLVTYQSGHVLGNIMNKASRPVAIEDWGWKQDTPTSPPYPVFITISTISKKQPELVSCKCKTACKPPYTCCMLGQPCLQQCSCPYL